jgi:hypothetical protein
VLEESAQPLDHGLLIAVGHIPDVENQGRV